MPAYKQQGVESLCLSVRTERDRLLLIKVLTPRTLNLPHVPLLCQGGVNVGGLGLCSLNCHALFLWALTSSGVLLQLTDFFFFFFTTSPLPQRSALSLWVRAADISIDLFILQTDKHLPKSYFMQGDKGFSFFLNKTNVTLKETHKGGDTESPTFYLNCTL